MIPAWLCTFFRYASLSTSSLRALGATYRLLGVLPEERDAIAHELAVRAWADAVEERLENELSCSWCSRGGQS